MRERTDRVERARVHRRVEGLVVVCFTNEADMDDDSLGEMIALGRALADRAGSSWEG